jgi:hypothetical protein
MFRKYASEELQMSIQMKLGSVFLAHSGCGGGVRCLGLGRQRSVSIEAPRRERNEWARRAQVQVSYWAHSEKAFGVSTAQTVFHRMRSDPIATASCGVGHVACTPSPLGTQSRLET